MKQNVICLLCCISVILIVVASGCITPPKENATILKKGTTADGKLIPGATATPKNFVTEVTPFVTDTPVSEYRTVPISTISPGDLYCRIYTTKTNKNDFSNKTAITFNLQNPPMLINYTVKPSNITYTDYIDYQITGQKEKQVKVDTYSPISWYVVKVMDKDTGEVYLEDGFGVQKYTCILIRLSKYPNRRTCRLNSLATILLRRPWYGYNRKEISIIPCNSIRLQIVPISRQTPEVSYQLQRQKLLPHQHIGCTNNQININ